MNLAEVTKKLEAAKTMNRKDRKQVHQEALDAVMQTFPEFAEAAARHKAEVKKGNVQSPYETEDGQLFQTLFDYFDGLATAYGHVMRDHHPQRELQPTGYYDPAEGVWYSSHDRSPKGMF